MELDLDSDDYCNCVFFVKPLKDSKELCLVCMVDEHGNNQHWERYQLKCGHIYHSRCFRRWCGVKQRMNCTYCGDIPEDRTTLYCDFHDKFGKHKGCPSAKYFFEHHR